MMIQSATAYDWDERELYRPNRIDLGDGLVFHVTPWRAEEFGFTGYPTGLYRYGELVYIAGGVRGRGQSLYFSDDAMSFLEASSVWYGSESTFVRFFSQGVLVYEYPVRYFMSDGGESIRNDGFLRGSWFDREQRYHDRANNTFQIITVEGREIVFCLSTGVILPERGVFERNVMLISVGAGVLVILAGVLVFKSKRTRDG